VWLHLAREGESLNVTFRCVCDALQQLPGSVASCGAAYSPSQEARGTEMRGLSGTDCTQAIDPKV